MNIYSEKGTRVKYTGTGGYDSHKEHANKYLKVGETYTVLNTNVSGWHTDVFLKEVPNQCLVLPLHAGHGTLRITWVQIY